MRSSDFVLRIPYGMRDFLPGEAAGKREIETALAQVFSGWGYEEVVTPAVEYLDTLTIGNGRRLEPHMFKFFDKNNQTLALRHEMTTPIARVAASRLSDADLPLKLSYIANVYRCEQAQTGRQCEFYQAGVELMGVPGASADAEVVALAIESLRRAGVEKFQISLGQVEFINGVMEQVKLPPHKQEEIKRAMVTRDLVGLGNIVEAAGLAKSAGEIIRRIPLLRGREELLQQAYRMVCNAQSKRALDNLTEIYRLLESYGMAEYVNFDLGVIRDFDYYTGMVFEGYAPGLGFPLCGGGRYDNMLSDFGSACPATGVALGIERIMLARERQGAAPHKPRRTVYVAWRDGSVTAAIEAVQKLRGAGEAAELGPWGQSEEEAREYQLARGYQRLVYIA